MESWRLQHQIWPCGHSCPCHGNADWMMFKAAGFNSDKARRVKWNNRRASKTSQLWCSAEKLNSSMSCPCYFAIWNAHLFIWHKQANYKHAKYKKKRSEFGHFTYKWSQMLLEFFKSVFVKQVKLHVTCIAKWHSRKYKLIRNKNVYIIQIRFMYKQFQNKSL